MICEISKILLAGEEENMTNLGLPEYTALNDFSYFKYVPITSTLYFIRRFIPKTP